MNRARLLAVFLAPLLVAAPPSPAAAQNRETLQLMAEVRMLQEQSQQLRLTLGALTETLKTVTAKLDEQTEMTRKAFADQKLLVDNLAGDVRVLREKIDDTNVRITSLSQDIEAIRITAAQPPPAADAAVEPGVAPEPGAGPPPAPAPPVVTPGVSPQRLFSQAESDYFAGQYDLAIQGFESYIRTFPQLERSAEAQFRIGESHFRAGRFKEAVEAYDRVISTYKTSQSVPDAYYKRGVALDALGETARARESFEYAVKNFPDTPAGLLAKQALEKIVRPTR